MPLRAFPDHKRSFLPSKTDKEKVSKLVHALKMGWIKTEAQKRKEREDKKEPKFYMLWGGDNVSEHMRRIHNHIPAPKRWFPDHAESYNPPPEYLFNSREVGVVECLGNIVFSQSVHTHCYFLAQDMGETEKRRKEKEATFYTSEILFSQRGACLSKICQ